MPSFSYRATLDRAVTEQPTPPDTFPRPSTNGARDLRREVVERRTAKGVRCPPEGGWYLKRNRRRTDVSGGSLCHHRSGRNFDDRSACAKSAVSEQRPESFQSATCFFSITEASCTCRVEQPGRWLRLRVRARRTIAFRAVRSPAVNF